MDSEDRKKQALDLYKKYYPLFDNEFKFTILESSVIIELRKDSWDIPFATLHGIKFLKRVIKLKFPKQKV